MVQRTAPFLEGKFGWDFGESGWNAGADENFLKFSYLFDRNIDGVVDTLPTSVVNGEAYFLTSDNRVYYVVNSSWYSTPVPKWFVIVEKVTGKAWQFNGELLIEVVNPDDLEISINELQQSFTSLGSAALEDKTYFASSSQLDVAISETQGYADGVGISVLEQMTEDGEDIIGINGSKLSGFYGEKVSIESFGVVAGGDATAAFAAAKVALAGTNKVLHLPNSTYVLTATVAVGGLTIFSDGCQLLKRHKGVGLLFEGGVDFFDFEGTLFVDGDGIGYYSALDGVAPTATNEHGIHFNGNGFRIRGIIHSRNHAGDAYRFTANGNMNRSSADQLWGWNSNRNFYFEGTQDDFSVIQMDLFSYASWAEGIRTSDNFSGRALTLYLYNESSSRNGTADGVYLGKMRQSEITVYSEPAATTGTGILVKASCDLLRIEETRGGSVINESVSTQITLGGQAYPRGLNPTVVTDRFEQSAASQRLYTKSIQGPGFVPLVDHAYRSDGQYQTRASQVGGSKTNKGGWRYDRYIQETFGGGAIADFYGTNGTEAAIAAIAAGGTFFELNAHLKSAVGYSHGFKMRAVADVVGPSTASTTSVIISSSNGSATPLDIVKILPSGDIETLNAGAGLIVKTNDGTKRYRISVSNAGAVVATLL